MSDENSLGSAYRAMNAVMLHTKQLEREVAALKAERDALLATVEKLVDFAEFWINLGERRRMSAQERETWYLRGYGSNTLRDAKAAIDAAREKK